VTDGPRQKTNRNSSSLVIGEYWVERKIDGGLALELLASWMVLLNAVARDLDGREVEVIRLCTWHDVAST
jgi:hypothetical protein